MDCFAGARNDDGGRGVPGRAVSAIRRQSRGDGGLRLRPIRPTICGTDLPVASSPLAKNISLFDLVETAIEHCRPALIRRGVTRRHERGARDAMDADGAARRAVLSRTAKSWRPDTPTLVSSLREISRRRRWQQSPAHRGDHEGNRKPSRGECRNVSAYLW
jgi:hypothetical protein